MFIGVTKKSMISLVFFLYLIATYSVIKVAVFEENLFLGQFWINFESAVGELEDISDKDYLQQILFLFFSSIITLIMLNFLIANVSTNYTKLEIT